MSLGIRPELVHDLEELVGWGLSIIHTIHDLTRHTAYVSESGSTYINVLIMLGNSDDSKSVGSDGVHGAQAICYRAGVSCERIKDGIQAIRVEKNASCRANNRETEVIWCQMSSSEKGL